MDLGGCGSSEPFALQVTDNSMEPEFKAGCIIIIDPAGVILKENDRYFIQPLHEDYLHERREIALEAIQGVIVQQAGSTGRRADRKRYTSI